MQSAGTKDSSAEWGDIVGGSMSMGLAGEASRSSTVESRQGQWLSTSIEVPVRKCSAVTSNGAARNWSISADYANMAMEFVLTYVLTLSMVPPCTDISSASKSHALWGRNQLCLTH